MTKDVLITVRGLQMTPDGDDTIEVTTTGKFYEKDGKLVSIYETPYGQMEMGVYTTGICLDEKDDFLQLKLEYLLEINNQHISDSEILVQIRPQMN